ncbi:MAG TPA: N-acetylmuramoyl-L-alanine amidase [Terriglobia bacterium]|nr:N-acetylmuramoyl-L-alanine amidase [Terriglobia bacterium]
MAVALLVALVVPSLSLASASKRAQAQGAYRRAVRMRVELEARPEGGRPLKDYQKLIRSFQLVYQLDPAYVKTPAALAGAAELYEEMGRQFSDDRYYSAAVKAYQFLIAQYPHALLARDALFTMGEIYRSDLEDPDQARNTFAAFIDRYPRSPQTAEARAKLNQINRLLARREKERPPRRQAPAAARVYDPRAPAAAPAPTVARVYDPRAIARNPELTDIRDWEGPEYTRVVIGLEHEVKFNARRLANPDRIVFDLEGTRLSPALAGRTFPVENGYLQQVRVAQYQPTVTRVVLDVQKIEDYSVFSLPNPFRLVIDIHGPPRSYRGPPGASSRTIAARTSSTSATSGTSGSGSIATRAAASAPASGVSGEDLSGPEASDSARGAAGESEASNSRAAAALARPAPISSGPAAPLSTGSTTLTRALGLKVARIVIDPGHGGHDTGTIGPGGLREKDVVLDVSLRLRKLIERRMGSQVIMTRSDDTFIPLEERTAIANQRAADLFISVHANASRDESARGIETYYLNFTSNPESLEAAARENATSQESVHQLQSLIKQIALTEKIQESRQFAGDVQRSLYAATTRAGAVEDDRGLKKAPFVVLIGARMPSILAEISFLTNPRDERLLERPEYRQKIAEGLYRGVAQYVETLGTVRIARKSSPRAASDLAGSPARASSRRHPPAESDNSNGADPPNR